MLLLCPLVGHKTAVWFVIKVGSLEGSSREERDGTRGGGATEGGAAPSCDTLASVRDGDPAALAEFFEWCFDRVYSLTARLLGDPTAAEDVTQEIFVKIQQAAGKLDPDRDPGPWVTVITYNACRDHWRSRGHRESKGSVPIEDASVRGDGLAATAPDPEAAFLSAERERYVQEALLRLPEDLRVVVILRDYHGMRHEKIAERVGASDAAVRKRYSRALARLAEELKGFWNE
jgi:RNA polymerase sigma-70 factor (ECF subfamily)